MNARPPGRAGGHEDDLRRSPVKCILCFNEFRKSNVRNCVLCFAAKKRLDLYILISQNIAECDFNIVLDLIAVICFGGDLNAQKK